MEILKTLRNLKKKTQAQIAKDLGISQQAYATYEIDTRTPPADMLIKLSTYFNVTIDFLLGNSVNPLPNSQLPDTEYHLDLYNMALREKGLSSVEHIFDITKEQLGIIVPDTVANVGIGLSVGVDGIEQEDIDFINNYLEIKRAQRSKK